MPADQIQEMKSILSDFFLGLMGNPNLESADIEIAAGIAWQRLENVSPA